MQERIEKRMRREKTPEQALAALMRLCSRAEKSSGDAVRLLTRWGIAPADQEPLLRRLTGERFIDDRRYAAAFVREKIRLSGWGIHKIRAALAAKRIDRTLIDEALRQLNPAEQGTRLEELLKRKARTTKANTPFQLKGKLVRYGQSQGYDFDTVMEAVGRLKIED